MTVYPIPGLTQEHRPRFVLQPFRSIRPSTALSYRIKGFLPRQGLAIVWGPPKQGKTFWTLDAVMHVALGWEYRGRKVVQGTVAYCLFEGIEGFRARVEAFRQRNLSDDADPPFHLMAEKVDLVADHQQLLERFEQQLGDDTPAVVVLDTLNRSLAGSESSDEDMGAYIRAADAIRERFGCLVLVIHHGPHSGQRPRGHSSLLGAHDALIKVSGDAGAHSAEVEEAKDFASGAQDHFTLSAVEVGTDIEGDPITSCVVEPTDTPAVTADPRRGLSENQRVMLTVLEEAGFGGLTVDEWNQRARDAGIGARRQALYETRVKLKRQGLIHESQGGKWHITPR
jgi:hypothetical protein